MERKILTRALAIVFAWTLVGCGDSNGAGTGGTGGSSDTVMIDLSVIEFEPSGADPPFEGAEVCVADTTNCATSDSESHKRCGPDQESAQGGLPRSGSFDRRGHLQARTTGIVFAHVAHAPSYACPPAECRALWATSRATIGRGLAQAGSGTGANRAPTDHRTRNRPRACGSDRFGGGDSVAFPNQASILELLWLGDRDALERRLDQKRARSMDAAIPTADPRSQSQSPPLAQSRLQGRGSQCVAYGRSSAAPKLLTELGAHQAHACTFDAGPSHRGGGAGDVEEAGGLRPEQVPRPRPFEVTECTGHETNEATTRSKRFRETASTGYLARRRRDKAPCPGYALLELPTQAMAPEAPLGEWCPSSPISLSSTLRADATSLPDPGTRKPRPNTARRPPEAKGEPKTARCAFDLAPSRRYPGVRPPEKTATSSPGTGRSPSASR